MYVTPCQPRGRRLVSLVILLQVLTIFNNVYSIEYVQYVSLIPLELDKLTMLNMAFVGQLSLVAVGVMH
jgi:hypothetical protein